MKILPVGAEIFFVCTDEETARYEEAKSRILQIFERA